MKLEKKMATLLTAILIAMMGVMPALAANPVGVPLTVTVTPIVNISVDPTSVNFGTFGGSPQTATITITNDGNVALTVSAAVSGEPFVTHLVVSGSYTSIAYGATGDADLTLNLPADYAAGTHTGSITFSAIQTLEP